MPILQVIVVLIVLALAWWIFQTYVLPHIPDPFRTIIIVLLALLAIWFLLSVVGIVAPIHW
jgi:hypothetical protein